VLPRPAINHPPGVFRVVDCVFWGGIVQSVRELAVLVQPLVVQVGRERVLLGLHLLLLMHLPHPLLQELHLLLLLELRQHRRVLGLAASDLHQIQLWLWDYYGR
jgi:hypothetical protein